jgi:hypothetical protein
MSSPIIISPSSQQQQPQPAYQQHRASTRISESFGDNDDAVEFHDADEYSKPTNIRPSLQPAALQRKNSQQYSVIDTESKMHSDDIDDDKASSVAEKQGQGESTEATKSYPTVNRQSLEKPAYALNVNNTTSSKPSYSTSASSSIQPSSQQQQPLLNRSLSKPLPPVPVMTSQQQQQSSNKNANHTNGATLNKVSDNAALPSSSIKGQDKGDEDHAIIKNLDTGEACDINDMMNRFPDEMMTIDQYEAQRINTQQQQRPRQESQSTRPSRSDSVSQVSDAGDLDDNTDSQAGK